MLPLFVNIIFKFSIWCLILLFVPGTPLHNAAKARKKAAVEFLIENGAFLPPDINDMRFNPPLHYCPGLDWAYEMKRLREESQSSGDCSSSTSDS